MIKYDPINFKACPNSTAYLFMILVLISRLVQVFFYNKLLYEKYNKRSYIII